MKHTIPEGEIKYLTVDVKALHKNQLLARKNYCQDTGEELPPCWIQVGDDKQNKINCWHVTFKGPGKLVYGHPRLCGAMMYVETTAELEYEA